MIDCENEVFTRLANVLRTEFPGINLTGEYLNTPPKFPHVSIIESDNAMNSLAETVYLKATPEVLAMHLKMGKIERPLIKGKTNEELLQYIRESLQVREPYYTQARHTLDVTLLDNYDKIKISVQLLREQLGLVKV